MIEVKDRIPTKPNRIKLVSEEDGTAKYYTLSRADEPTVDGTPINKELFDSISKDITNLINSPGDNILINSDFRKPINQRGKTLYSGGTSESTINGMYTIDRWIKRNYGTTIELLDGYIRFKTESEPTAGGTLTYAFLQSIEYPELMLGNTYTLSCKIKNVVGSHMLGVWQAVKSHYSSESITGGISSIEITEPGEYAFTFTVDDSFSGDYDKINIGFTQPDPQHNVGDYIDIEYVKLEIGQVATPFVNRPIANELNICNRYYQKYYKVPIYTTSASGVTYRGLIMSPMRTNPTMVIDNIYDGSGVEKTGVTMTAKVTSETNAVNLVLSSSIGQYGYVTYSLDAEVY